MKRSTLRRFTPRPTYGNVIATVALFVALGGVAVAAGLPRNSVGPRQIKRGAVNASKLHRNAVTPGKIRRGAVTPGKLGANAVLPGNLGNGIISTAKLANGAVNAAKMRNGIVTTNKLKNGGVTSAKLADNAVNANKLADKSVTRAKLNFQAADPGVVSPLASGQTLRGVFDVGSGASVAGDVAKGMVNYFAPLAAPPTVTVLLPGQMTANCPGLGAGNSTPAATAGNLCVYLTVPVNLADTLPGEALAVETNTALGFGLAAKAKAAGNFAALGVWAVTAP